MSKNATDNVVLNEARTAQQFWAQHPEIKLKETSCSGFKKAADEFETASDGAGKLEVELHQKIVDRDQLGAELKLVTARLRSVVKGIYGPNSTEYGSIGGTRQADRKRPQRQNGSSETAVAAPATSNNEKE